MAGVLTMKASTVTCMHSGEVSTESSTRLQVNGNAVLLKEDIKNWSIKNCLTPNNEKEGNRPCKEVLAVSTGFASKLKVNGQPVLLEASIGWGQTNGTVGFAPQPLAPDIAGQTRLQAV